MSLRTFRADRAPTFCGPERWPVVAYGSYRPRGAHAGYGDGVEATSSGQSASARGDCDANAADPERRVLVYGFEPFGRHTSNPSQQLVQALGREGTLDNATLYAAVLPVAYEAAAAALARALERARPTVVLGLGLAARRPQLSVERFALNLDDCALPDNDGEIRRAQPIERQAPWAAHSTADLVALSAALRDGGVDHDISNHAGGYLCNHSYYRVLRHCAGREIHLPCVFVHVPLATAEPLHPSRLTAIRLLLRSLISQAHPEAATNAEGGHG